MPRMPWARRAGRGSPIASAAASASSQTGQRLGVPPRQHQGVAERGQHPGPLRRRRLRPAPARRPAGTRPARRRLVADRQQVAAEPLVEQAARGPARRPASTRSMARRTSSAARGPRPVRSASSAAQASTRRRSVPATLGGVRHRGPQLERPLQVPQRLGQAADRLGRRGPPAATRPTPRPAGRPRASAGPARRRVRRSPPVRVVGQRLGEPLVQPLGLAGQDRAVHRLGQQRVPEPVRRRPRGPAPARRARPPAAAPRPVAARPARSSAASSRYGTSRPNAAATRSTALAGGVDPGHPLQQRVAQQPRQRRPRPGRRPPAAPRRRTGCRRTARRSASVERRPAGPGRPRCRAAPRSCGPSGGSSSDRGVARPGPARPRAAPADRPAGPRRRGRWPPAGSGGRGWRGPGRRRSPVSTRRPSAGPPGPARAAGPRPSRPGPCAARSNSLAPGRGAAGRVSAGRRPAYGGRRRRTAAPRAARSTARLRADEIDAAAASGPRRPPRGPGRPAR